MIKKRGVIKMEWLSYLVLLLCPLMMIFCMKGHGGGHKHHDSHSSKDFNNKVDNLETENAKLRKEIDALSSIVRKES
ncbi:hypothetical protein CVD25_13640 [Bacillus canaveralius]|uniref:DUF2933 domain-containing protein n=3 Tax=Bacillus TaxID=1386 RepID=A0A2N5GQ26_9BACI|nr:DUF2933 domain-containing protein [Bacillus canaveralius]PLR83704.1 hypothetical protein CVD23_13530 [Bacillus sp. V33-4]PLR84936.1 hypothetical protein CU635_05395 [Bacillus canaveralius]PLR95838.1 hypothetical protein CVD25_13640 [Bacillus canaveralius]